MSLRGEEPTPQALRRTSADLRRAGDLAAAEAACSQAIELHPTDLALAIEHAKIAKAAKDLPLRMIRWQRVLDIGGDQAPATAFDELANCHRTDPAAAEALLRRGLALYPADFSLLRKLGDLASARGLIPDAIDAWQAAIKANPEKDLVPLYLQLGQALHEEGLLARAETILREGVAKYPADTPLRDAHAHLAYLLAIPSRKSVPCDPSHPATCHLFQDRYQPSARGILSFSPGSSALRQHVPAMLDFAEIVPAPKEPGALGAVDAFAIWGAPSDSHLPSRETAAATGKPLLCLESGFLSSHGIEGRDAPALSMIVTRDAVYYDATHPSEIVDLLNSDTFTLTDGQAARAENCIAAIVANRLSKFNHAPRIDLRPRFPADGTRRILLIDQRKRGGSVHWSLGGQATFERMMETALAMRDCQIFVKIHPEAIADRSSSFLAPLIPSPLPENFAVIDFAVNPHDLLEVVDEVFVGTSQMGFEAVLAGKQVHCFAAPYYSGWGFTQDRTVIPRRHRRRTPTEIFHLYHIVHSRYFVPDCGVAEIEDLISHLVAVRDIPSPSALVEESPGGPLKILIVLPSGRDGATGRYIRHLAAALVDLGCEIMVLAEGNCPRLDSGVRWMKLEFEGVRLAASLRREILGFAPDFVYVNGYRSRSQRAALEAVMLTGARLAMQWEDDDTQVHRHRRSEQAAAQLCALDRPRLTTAEIAGFLKNYDWNHGLRSLLDPEFDRWVEPLPRLLCSRLASLHTGIWHPYAERLAREFAVPTLVVPPVASAADFQRLPMTPQERAATLLRYDIDPAATVIFIGGALYSYSDEFAVFLTALDLAAREPAANFALVVTSGHSSLPLAPMAAERLGPSVSFTDIGDSPDAVYLEMLKACDIACSPGLPDDFNRYRLPSRLVKSMAMAKPILTCRCGFGESLEHGHNAFLMDGRDPTEWADVITLTRDATIRAEVGNRGQHFAREHFDAPRVAGALKQQFELSLLQPPRTLATGITVTEVNEIRTHPGIRLRNRNSSPLHSAIHALALRTHRLDTVVHVGTSNGGALEDYCRLGVQEFVLVEGSSEMAGQLRKTKNASGTISAEELVVSADGKGLFEAIVTKPLPESDYHLLTIETEGTVTEAFVSTPPEFLQQFRWIITCMAEIPAGTDSATTITIEQVLNRAGFKRHPIPENYACLIQAMLFERARNQSKADLITGLGYGKRDKAGA